MNAERKTEEEAQVAPSGGDSGPAQAGSSPKPSIHGEAIPDETEPPVPEALTYFASIYPGEAHQLPATFVAKVLQLQEKLDMPVFLIVQKGGPGPYCSMDAHLEKGVLASTRDLPPDSPVALLLHSPGGLPRPAYRIAAILKRHCGQFTAVIPEYAKSGATLVALGAERILMGRYAELGPLDVQIIDPDREEYTSALDEVQALERLHAFALEALDRSMNLVVLRTRKTVKALLPDMLRFITDMVRPLFDKIEVVHYTQMSRALKMVEEYAFRLLQPQYPQQRAREIAEHLVAHYPDHTFVIDVREAQSLGLSVEEASGEEATIMDAILPDLDAITAIGLVKRRNRP